MEKIEELHCKLHRVRAWMHDQGVGGLLLRRRPNFAWITCGGQSHVNTATDVGAAAVLITPDRLALVANNIEMERFAAEQVAGLPFDRVDFPWHDAGRQARLIEELTGGGRLAADTPGYALAADEATQVMRASLLPPEIDRMRGLGRVTTRIIEEVCRRMEPGWTEYRVAAELLAAATAAAVRVPVCLVAADERIRQYRHPVPTPTVIHQRAMVVVCMESHGLICSATRVVSFAPLDEELRRRHRAVCAIDAGAISATRAGRPFRDIFNVITAAYAEEGFPDEWRYHHQGGSTGYQPRDALATPTSEAVVQSDQAFAWNPSIAGTKSEDTVLITAQGWTWMTAPGEGWPVVEIHGAGHCLRRADILVRG